MKYVVLSRGADFYVSRYPVSEVSSFLARTAIRDNFEKLELYYLKYLSIIKLCCCFCTLYVLKKRKGSRTYVESNVFLYFCDNFILIRNYGEYKERLIILFSYIFLDFSITLNLFTALNDIVCFVLDF